MVEVYEMASRDERRFRADYYRKRIYNCEKLYKMKDCDKR